MAQGKLKVKTSVPGKLKKVQKINKQGITGIKKSKKTSKKQQLQKAFEKTLRVNIENEIRAIANPSASSVSKKSGRSKSSK